MFKFSIRDIIFLTIIVSLLLALHLHNQQWQHIIAKTNDHHNKINGDLRKAMFLMHGQADLAEERRKRHNSVVADLKYKITALENEKTKTKTYIEALEQREESKHVQRLYKEIAQLNKDKDALREWQQSWMDVAARQDKEIANLKAEIEKQENKN